MSEKRFVIGDDNIAMFEVIDMEKEELVCECRAVDVETLVDLLNSLAEENEWLKKEKYELIKFVTNGKRISYHEMIELQNENEQLKKENIRFKRMLENLGYKVVMIDE